MSAAAVTGSPLGRRLRLAWLVALLGSVVFLVGCLLLAILGEDQWDGGLAIRLLVAGTVVPPAAALGLLAAVVICRGALRATMLAAMVLLACAAAGWSIVIWSGFTSESLRDLPLWRLLATCTLAGALLAWLGFLLTSPARRKPLIIGRRVLAGSSILLVSGLLLMIWTKVLQGHMTVLAVAAALGLAGLVPGLIGHGLTAWIVHARRPRVESIAARARLELVCPRCEHRQELPCGIARCEQCSLALSIDIEEPRCECGYLLFQLQGDACPECGRVAKRVSGFES